jgi:hypothetical protein
MEDGRYPGEQNVVAHITDRNAIRRIVNEIEIGPTSRDVPEFSEFERQGQRGLHITAGSDGCQQCAHGESRASQVRRGVGLLLPLRLSATAARMRSFNAASSIFSPS